MRPKILSTGIRKIPNLYPLLNAAPNISFKNSVLGWGYKSTSKKAKAYATRHNLKYIALEDGFLRSVGLGVEGYPPLSLVADDLGIYYAAKEESRLEKLIRYCSLNESQSFQAQKALKSIIHTKLSKYNHAPSFPVEATADCHIVLVIDQTFGDMSVEYGLANEQTFSNMLQAALEENPDSDIWVKIHPDVISGKKKGYLTKLNDSHRIKILAQDVNPPTLLSQVDKVYCVTSHMGFEALLLGKPVVTFGVPWFSGWGLTDDRHSFVTQLRNQKRRIDRDLLTVFYSAYFEYAFYIDPFTGRKGNIFDVIRYLEWIKPWQSKFVGHFYCIGLSLWKKTVLKPFFHFPHCHLHFVRSFNKFKRLTLPDNSKLLIWGQGSENIINYAKQNNIEIWRMEDGFIRSVGLGSNLVAPLSLVVDNEGIYFNPNQPSQLELILQHHYFSPHDEYLAALLHKQLIESNIGKYNVGYRGFERPKTDKKIILVPGQVEDDASIRFGSPICHSNLCLLQTVRKNNPNTYIIYKPHPDVLSGNRKGNIKNDIISLYADQVVTEANILDCIQAVDEIHTMTSLAGFEALLRDKTVYCYGSPFYAHWGLTIDTYSLERRKRKLTLNQLIAGTLIHYPLYLNPNTGQLTNAETAVQLLLEQRQQLSDSGLYKNWFSKKLGKYYYFIRNFWLK